MESIFKKYYSIVSSQNINLKEFFLEQMSKNINIDLPDCHKLKTKIMKRFVIFRLRISLKKSKLSTKKLASKSVAGILL